jgi:hypothetical protein
VKVLKVAYDNFMDHMRDREFPACFKNVAQWESWYEVEKIAHTKPRYFPCRDCTNEYRSQMGSRCANADLPGVKRIMNKGS